MCYVTEIYKITKILWSVFIKVFVRHNADMIVYSIIK